ncbi:MAG: DUF423 domain-containing protein [Acetobacteraceae bacterium]
MQRLWIGLGGLAGLGAVAMAALGAHGLAHLDPAALGMVRSAVQMQGWHALALIGCGLWVPRGGWPADLAGMAFTIGIVLFCGAVYSLALGGIALGMLAPIGGTLLMVGWLLMALSALRAPRRDA